MRAVLRDPQLVEQLVEVLTIVSYSWWQLRMEQNVDIPVPGRGGRISRLQHFPPGQSSTTTPSSKKRFSERIVEQIVAIPGGVLQDFRPGQSSPSSLHVPASIPEVTDEPGEEVYITLPQHKKSAASASSPGQRVFASVSPPTPAPHHRVRLLEWVMILSDQAPSGRVRCLVQLWMHVLREALDEFQYFLRCVEVES